MEALRSNNDTASLGYSTTKKGESSTNAEQSNNKGKNIMTTFHHCEKLGHKKSL